MRVYATPDLLPLALCKIILNKFDWVIWQGVSTLFELSDAYRLSDFLLPCCCHKNDFGNQEFLFLYSVPQISIASIMGRMDSPSSDRAYSTLGGTSG